jgi:hypothetical protein
MNCIWSTVELPDQLLQFIIAQIYKKGDETDCSK